MPTTATTIKEGHKYQLGDLLIWYEQKPGEGRRVRLFVKSGTMPIVTHVDRPLSSGYNRETPTEG